MNNFESLKDNNQKPVDKNWVEFQLRSFYAKLMEEATNLSNLNINVDSNIAEYLKSTNPVEITNASITNLKLNGINIELCQNYNDLMKEE